MRLFVATVVANTGMRGDLHLIELHAPYLAQSAQPGQYCMVRCCHPLATDPLLRRPFFIHGIQRERGVCSLLVRVKGRGTAWLARQQEGAELDILGPLGHGWSVRPTVRNLLLISENELIAGLALLAHVALEQELVVTLLCKSETVEDAYPPALLPPEVEYQIVTDDLISAAQDYVNWADAACCGVSRETSLALYNRFERMRGRHFAQTLLLRPLACGNGVCLTCNVETRGGQKLVCRDGPVFALRDIAR